MKRFMSILGALVALTASAQQNLLSTYTVDPVTNVKTWSGERTYDNGRLTEIHNTYYYAEGNVEEKTVYVYDDLGRPVRNEFYSLYQGEWLMTGKWEILEWNADGQASTWITYNETEEAPGQLSPALKYIAFAYNGENPADYDVYTPDGAGDWAFYAKIRSENDSRGEIGKLVQEIYFEGEPYYVTTIEYEYDEHRWLTRETYVSPFETRETNYQNFYDANGVIEKRNTYLNGQWSNTQFYIWSDATALKGMKSAKDSPSPWYDLNGRRVDNPKKGVYIRNGKKVVF